MEVASFRLRVLVCGLSWGVGGFYKALPLRSRVLGSLKLQGLHGPLVLPYLEDHGTW